MLKNKLKQKLGEENSFIINVELTAGPNFNIAPAEKFLNDYKKADKSVIPADFDFTSITFPQNPGGVANVEPCEMLKLQDLMDDLDFVPHISCKDHNADSIISSLMAYKNAGLESIFVVTGDKPLKAKGVFELESLGLLQLITKINNSEYIKAKPEALENVHQFYPGAAVSPFKYTQASQMQQYYKMEKKIKAGAKFLITQVGWDWKKSLELFTYLKENNIDIPVLGNVYLLSTATPAPRLMHDNKLPGCFVSDALFEKVQKENLDQHIERAAQQVAMYKSIGARGVDIGGVHDFDIFIKILNRAAQISPNWQDYKENLYWPADKAFYLYGQSGKRTPLSKPKKKSNHRLFNLTHRAILNPEYRGFHIFKKIMKFLGTEKNSGFFYKLFDAAEKPAKYLMFDCEQCGDCYLPENFSWCTIGGCEKGLNNAPCGDSTPDGYCGNNLERICIGENIYLAAAAEKNGLQKLRKQINKPRNPALANTSSVLNYLFSKDHTMKNALISIGESVHASIPKTGQVMKALADKGPDAYTNPSGELNYIKALMQSQADDGADYIAVNLDAFGETDPQITINMMTEYVKMVRKWGKDVPVCIDSSNDDVLIAGLKEWYNADTAVKKPLINSIKTYTAEKMLPLKNDYDFCFVGLLVGEQRSSATGGSHSVEELFAFARQIFDLAVNKFNFKPQEIFFDSTVFPLAIDMPMEPNTPGYTYRAFETIKKIKNDPEMKNAHTSLGISNCVRDLPGRKIGICRAYVAKAIEYGLDAGIVNTAHHYGQTDPDPKLLELVDAFAKMDGSPEKMNKSMTLMGQFCQQNRKPAN
ncbi:MAG: methylenetetrahydrofolate reductase C-terminal domain-containing protein [Planctomycetes bacterium]|nr:methylenetetrahydrofolate reductase C-terminal domain-containing protein [Planctomycetota bacterium]MBL7106836.1 methylenetetrahydrofolate reductase C-terminal domain-containing protein [Phycisphaerae bacterium]